MARKREGCGFWVRLAYSVKQGCRWPHDNNQLLGKADRASEEEEQVKSRRTHALALARF